MNAMVRTRFAPTPSGFLHAGNIFSFVLTWLLAREHQGRIVLRIDDLDGPRTRTDVIEDLFRTLDWMGLTWDEGPVGPGDFYARWSQHLRIERYLDVAHGLRQQGLLFPCSCSRKQVAESSSDGQYPGTCRHRIEAMKAQDCAWRLLTPSPSWVTLRDLWRDELTMDVYQCLRDPVLVRRDGIPAYQLASVVDDVDYDITHVVRGADLLSSSAVQTYLAQQAGLSRYLDVVTLHHPLLLDASHSKLSKSARSISLSAMRSQGGSVSAVLQWIARRLDLNAGVPENLESLLIIFKAQGGSSKLKAGQTSAFQERVSWQWSE